MRFLRRLGARRECRRTGHDWRRHRNVYGNVTWLQCDRCDKQQPQ